MQKILTFIKSIRVSRELLGSLTGLTLIFFGIWDWGSPNYLEDEADEFIIQAREEITELTTRIHELRGYRQGLTIDEASEWNMLDVFGARRAMDEVADTTRRKSWQLFIGGFIIIALNLRPKVKLF